MQPSGSKAIWRVDAHFVTEPRIGLESRRILRSVTKCASCRRSDVISGTCEGVE